MVLSVLFVAGVELGHMVPARGIAFRPPRVWVGRIGRARPVMSERRSTCAVCDRTVMLVTRPPSSSLTEADNFRRARETPHSIGSSR